MDVTGCGGSYVCVMGGDVVMAVGLVRAVKEVKQSGILWGFRCGYAEVSCCVC